MPHDQQLGALVELNSAQWMRRAQHLPWVTLHEEPDVIWSFAGDNWPGNHAALARFKPTTARNRIREILACHWEHKVACNWIVGPLSQPEDIGKHLRDNGFSCRIHCAGMACELTTIGAAPSIPKDIQIDMLAAPPSLVPLTTERRKRRHEGRKLIGTATDGKTHYFSATFQGKPVGETALFDGGPAGAGIYDVEVLEKFRGRGIGSALIHAALRHAGKLGQSIAVLGATGIGSGVYTRAGFREVCKISFWKYGKMRQL